MITERIEAERQPTNFNRNKKTMNLIKKTVLAVVVNVLIIASFFIFVNCFNKQEMWPVVVSGIFLLAFVVVKLNVVSKESSRSQTKYYR